MTSHIDATFGALLLGGFCAATLSGVVVVQAFLYMKLFPRDSARVKAIVGVVWTLDTTHSLLVYASIWIYLITNYGNVTKIDTIPIVYILIFFLARLIFMSQLTVITTVSMILYDFVQWPNSVKAVLTFIVHWIHMKTFTAFKAKFRWVFTLGLAMSCLVDILVTGFLTHSLQTLQSDKRSSTSLDRVIGAVVLYTFETNLLTSAATIVSMICWLAMPNNLVFMGLHFFISKLYANSLLATLNTRKQLQHQRQRGASADLPTGFPRFSSIPRRTTGRFSARNEHAIPTKLEITVEKTVEFGADEPSPLESQKRVSIIEPQFE
ncbi:hypothetical protein OG21DRAFT_1487267 [Imleria badia]|nr:hypothetical protein OG21DRAFT_1487267 [Imleria badia]